MSSLIKAELARQLAPGFRTYVLTTALQLGVLILKAVSSRLDLDHVQRKAVLSSIEEALLGQRAATPLA